jgi:hypothetical protein
MADLVRDELGIGIQRCLTRVTALAVDIYPRKPTYKLNTDTTLQNTDRPIEEPSAAAPLGSLLVLAA